MSGAFDEEFVYKSQRCLMRMLEEAARAAADRSFGGNHTDRHYYIGVNAGLKLAITATEDMIFLWPDKGREELESALQQVHDLAENALIEQSPWAALADIKSILKEALDKEAARKPPEPVAVEIDTERTT